MCVAHVNLRPSERLPNRPHSQKDTPPFPMRPQKEEPKVALAQFGKLTSARPARHRRSTSAPDVPGFVYKSGKGRSHGNDLSVLFDGCSQRRPLKDAEVTHWPPLTWFSFSNTDSCRFSALPFVFPKTTAGPLSRRSTRPHRAVAALASTRRHER